MDNRKNLRVTFYAVCGLLLGAPFLWKLLKLIPELLSTLPNAKEILLASFYTALVIASLVVAWKLRERVWLRIVAIYASIALGACVLVLLTRALGGNEIFTVLFEIVCAPFYGINSPLTVVIIMLVLSITAYSLLGRLPAEPQTPPQSKQQ